MGQSENISLLPRPVMERMTYSPACRGHKPTASQESNTLSTTSQVSCATILSLESQGGEETVVVVKVQDDCDVETKKNNSDFSPCLPSPGGLLGGPADSGSTPTTPLLQSRDSQESSYGRSVHNATVKLDIPPNSSVSGFGSDRTHRPDKIPGEPLKTLLSALFLGSGFLVTTISLALTHERVPEIDPLPDILLDNIRYQAWGLDVSEILLMVSTTSAVMLVLLHTHRLVILRRIWLLLGILYYYRALTMFVTVLPKADKTYTCMPRNTNTTTITYVKRVLTIISGGGLSINGKHIYCGDYIFSGHTMTLTMGYLTIRQYSPRRYVLLHWTSLLVSVCGVVFLLISRGHYTIDVLLAYYVTSRLWWVYHTMAHNSTLRTRGSHNLLDNFCWWHVFIWFEARVGGPLPHRYSLPLPRSLRRVARAAVSRVAQVLRRGSESEEEGRGSVKP